MNAFVKNIPNSITCLNIAAGVMAILCAAHGSASIYGLEAYYWAYICIGIAAAADFLDGFAARMLHAYSDVGKELDSICDVVSFGIAPAIVMFFCIDEMGMQHWTRWFILAIPVCGALRLARFNVDERQTSSFIGLPIPANAIFWIGYSALCYSGVEFMAEWYCLVPVLLFVSWLMLSPLPLFSLKFKTWGWRGNQWRWLLIVTAVALVAIMGVPGLMWLIVAYVLYGVFDRPMSEGK